MIKQSGFAQSTVELSTAALVCALKHRDIYTQLHSKRVIELSEAIGVACQLSSDEVFQLKISASLHDIGKIGIPDQILLKPAKLEPYEWEVMRTHSEKGEEIVRNLNIEGSDHAALAVRHHHEKYNGTGYPDQLSGESIPVFARIITIADSFDAMADARPYHKSRSYQQIMSVIEKEEGKYDPWILGKFKDIMGHSSHSW